MTSPKNIVVDALAGVPLGKRNIEICEHKGVGHPDSIMDATCEAASRELSLAYLQHYSRVLHHNLDKGLLVAGESAPRFGGGAIVQPVKLILCGRATRPDARLDVQQIAIDAARRCLSEHLRCDPGIFEIVTEIREGSLNLKRVFADTPEVPLANDSSFGAGFAPYTTTEKTVLAVAAMLRSLEFRQAFPAAGDDYKIIAHRIKTSLNLTVALAFVDCHVHGVRDYFEIKHFVQHYLLERLEFPSTLRINNLDDDGATDESGVYLTVSGLSAEMGDDGQVGRGNRVNGLITPGRAMSLEAAAGKNPVAHVGKLYNVLAMLIARDICEQFEEVEEANVQIVSAIGESIDCPQLLALEVAAKHGLTASLASEIKRVADRRLDGIEEVSRLIMSGTIPLH
jgi:S-adenosylmethionine synthetase